MSRKSYDQAQVERALRGRFRIHGYPVSLRVPVDWRRDPFQSQGYRSVLASLKWLDPLIYAYENGDPAALRHARDLALDWIRLNPRSGGTDKTWEDKVVGDRAPYLAYIARAAECEGMLSESDAKRFVESLEQHGRALAGKALYTPSNHGLFMDFGLTALAKEAPGLRGSSAWLLLAPRRFHRTLLSRVYPDEGMWLENSSSYHFAALSLVDRYLTLAADDAPASLRALGERMREVAGWLVEPDGRRVLLGDSNLKRTPADIASDASEDSGLLWLPRTGVAVIKTPDPNPGYLLFAATFQNSTHNQADALTFDLWANGKRITSDSGLFDKDPDPLQVFARSALSHSVLTIDGHTYPLGESAAYGSGLLAHGGADGWYALEGRNPLAGIFGVVHHRLLLYRPGTALVVCDFVHSDVEHSYTRYLQLGLGLDASRRGNGLSLTSHGSPIASLEWEGDGHPQVKLVSGSEYPPAGLLFPHFRQVLGRTTVALTNSAQDLAQSAVFGLDPSNPVSARVLPGSDPGAASVSITGAGGTSQVIHVKRDGESLDLDFTP